MSASLAVPLSEPLVPGLSNLRDFGGHPTRSGGFVVANRLYRAAAPHSLAEMGVSRLAGLGVSSVIDLRGIAEAAAAPSTVPADHNVVRIFPAPVEPNTSAVLRDLARRDQMDGPAMRQLMIETYRAFATDRAADFGRALALLLRASDRPVMIHCTAGKDRTGFLVALVLSLLDVSWDVIAADYLATNDLWDRAGVASAASLRADARAALLSADIAYLDAAFAAIALHHATISDFAVSILGPDAALLDRLPTLLVDAPSNPVRMS